MSSNRPNILLVILDTVRAANLSGHGYTRNTAPFLARFGDQSIDYQRAYAPAPWTTPSHASIFTGTYNGNHQTNRDRKRLTPDLPTLAELLAASGYDTVCFSNNAHISPDFNFDRGFDRFIFNSESYNEPFDNAVSVSRIRSHTGNGLFHKQAFEALNYVRQNEGSLNRTVLNWFYRKASEAGIISNRDRGAVSTNQFVDQYLQEIDNEPFFMYLNYMEAHAPYQSPDKYQYRYIDDPVISDWGNQADYFGERITDQERKVAELEDQYDGCIRYLDSQIKILVDILKKHGYFGNTIVVITSDHGEAFGEWGLYEHKAGVYDELSHVPLLINPPESESDTINMPVSCRWLYPTLLRAADISVPDHAVTTDIMKPSCEPVIIESEGLPYDESIYESSLSRKFGLPHQGYVKGGKNMKLIRYELDDSVELYNLPDESEDIASDFTETAETMYEQLNEILKRNEQSVRTDVNEEFELNEETRKHLRELGYY